jgi:hypothetical protein
MDMTATSMAPESASTCCAICARPARRGERLCAQCKTAVKRARQVPNVHTQFLPRPGASPVASPLPSPLPSRGEGRVAHLRRVARTALHGVPAGWGTYATLVAFGAAVSITGYFATNQQEEASSRERVSQTARTASAAPMRDKKEARGQPSEPSLAETEGPPGEDAKARIEWTLPQQAASAHLRGEPPGRKSARDARSAGDESPSPIDARNSAAEPPPAPNTAGETVAGSRAAQPPDAQATAGPDRRQLMAAAIARCERESFVAGFVCKERAWLQFCEGQWGEVPQCPGGVLGNNTR